MTESVSPSDHGTRQMRRWFAPLFVVALLLIFVAGFFFEENWRGERGWRRTKAELEAKGEILDWTHYLPDPPSDDRNMMKVPGMEETFIRGRTKGIPISTTPFRIVSRTNYVRYGEIELVNDRQDAIASLANLRTNFTAKRRVARVFWGRELPAPSGFCLMERKPGAEVKRVALSGNGSIDLNDFGRTNNALTQAPDKVEQIGTNTVALLMSPGNSWYGAQEFLEWSAGQSNLFAMLDEAAKRPVCWLPGDYSIPQFWPIPNYVAIRSAAQVLGARAQACLLLNRPDEAYAELERIDHLNRITAARPLTLVAAMIRVAVTGLQTSIIEQGFAMGAWEDRHCRGFIKSYGERRLLPDVIESLRSGERAGIIRMVEMLETEEGRKLIEADAGGSLKSLNASLQMMPRGWERQNLVFFAQTMQGQIDLFDTRLPIDPKRVQRDGLEIIAGIERWSPMRIVARMGVANILRAGQTALKVQTSINEVVIASALELYRRENGRYPGTLPDLTSKYLERIAPDLILGQSLRYQRRQNGEYALYSIAWNGTDDLGCLLANADTPMLEIFQSKAAADDWVWTGVPEPPEN